MSGVLWPGAIAFALFQAGFVYYGIQAYREGARPTARQVLSIWCDCLWSSLPWIAAIMFWALMVRLLARFW